MRTRSVRLASIALAVGILAAPSARANHSSGSFEQPVWFFWETAELDVLIVPPNHGQIYNNNSVLNHLDPNELNPLANSYLRAIENSVRDWQRAIDAHGPSWLADGLHVRAYVIGRDDVPQSALFDPEVVITTDEHKGSILGVAVSSRPCLVDNSKFFTRSMNYEDMFNINAQEYGHCLGLNHVPGDAKGTKEADYTDGDLHDPMNGLYPHTPGSAGTDLHCVSNLNVAGLAEVFSEELLGWPGEKVAKVAVGDYIRPATC